MSFSPTSYTSISWTIGQIIGIGIKTVESVLCFLKDSAATLGLTKKKDATLCTNQESDAVLGT